MTTPTLAPAPATVPDKYGGDPVAFDTAMQNWLAWQATRAAQDPAFLAWIEANANTIAAQANAAQADRIICAAAQAAVTTQSPAANAAAAAASAALAAGYASTAQATNPDSPVRLNPRSITANLTIASGYNADSVGPIRVADGISVVVGYNATWCVS